MQFKRVKEDGAVTQVSFSMDIAFNSLHKLSLSLIFNISIIDKDK
jgi:hypothetical protein